MGWMTNWRRWLGRQVRPMGRTGLAVAVALACLAVAGGVWLAAAPGGPSLVDVSERPLSESELNAAEHAVAVAGIAMERRDGRILVPAGRLAEARAAVFDGAEGTSGTDRFESLAESGDLWSTDAQNAQRWQAAKMSALSEIIARFPSVCSASVIVDGGSPQRLGRPAVDPTAAVELCMADGQEVTLELVDAVADLVSGSVAGMRRQDVRIIDSAGRSHWAAAETAGAGTLMAVRQAESYYARKIRDALAYVCGAVVTVQVAPAGEGALRLERATVSVPRSYLQAVCPDEVAGEAEFQLAAQAHLDRLRQAALIAIGSEDLSHIQMRWHHDAPATTARVAPTVRSEGPVAGTEYFVLGGVLVAAAGCVLTARALHRRARRARRRDKEAAEAAGDIPPVVEAEPLAFLAELDEEQLIALARQEHPQTVALIMANVQAPQAAAVLASLAAATQVQVVQRLASLDEMDEQVLMELAHGLAGRVARLAGEGCDDGRIGRIAEILHHAGYHTECRVLDGLLGPEPELADSLRNRMFAFDDIVKLPAATLRAAMDELACEEVAVALRTAGKDLRKKVLAALNSDAARRVRREMDHIGPVRLSDVEAAQRRLVEAVRQARYGRYVGHAHRVGTEVTA